MAHGHPDYGGASPLSTVYTLQDLAEHAVRLGSPVSFDRRGNVMWFDDFESGIQKWHGGGLGEGWAVAASAAAARNGAFSVKLTTGAVIDYAVELSHRWYFPALSKVGFEASFAIVDTSHTIEFTQYFFDGSHRHYGGLRYLPDDDKLQYYDENGDWQDLATGLDLVEYAEVFHTIKLVMDLSTHKYVRALLNDVEYDLSALNYQLSVADEAPVWYQQVLVATGANDNRSIYVDDVILTQNEP